MRSRRTLLLSGLAAALVAILSGASPLAPRPTAAAPSTQPATTWVTNGSVSAVARVGTTIYLGGEFTYVGPPTGSWVTLDASSGRRDAGWPVFNGPVQAMAPDGAGGWYVGGNFTRAGGLVRNNLARVKADKTIDPTWNPNVASGGRFASVLALAVSGGTVYVGGALPVLAGGLGTTSRPSMPPPGRSPTGTPMPMTGSLRWR
jgi:hypothetical protein